MAETNTNMHPETANEVMDDIHIALHQIEKAETTACCLQANVSEIDEWDEVKDLTIEQLRQRLTARRHRILDQLAKPFNAEAISKLSSTPGKGMY